MLASGALRRKISPFTTASGSPQPFTMAEIKTKKTAVDPARYLNAIRDEQARADCRTIAKMMEKATKAKPKMWGPSIVGFGSCRYKYPDGREMDWMLIAFSPRQGTSRCTAIRA